MQNHTGCVENEDLVVPMVGFHDVKKSVMHYLVCAQNVEACQQCGSGKKKVAVPFDLNHNIKLQQSTCIIIPIR